MTAPDDDVRPRGSRERVRVRFCEDDHEMSVIYDGYLRVQMVSKTRRGRVRRGAGATYLRQLLVAGYKSLYGAFPPLTDEHAFTAPSPASSGDSGRDTRQSDIKTKVAIPEQGMNNQLAQPAAQAAAATGSSEGGSLDFGALLGGGVTN